MIKLKFIAYALFFLSRALCQVDNLDWPNLGKYEKDAVPEFIPKEAGHYIFSCSDDKGRNSSVKTSVRFI